MTTPVLFLGKVNKFSNVEVITNGLSLDSDELVYAVTEDGLISVDNAGTEVILANTAAVGATSIKYSAFLANFGATNPTVVELYENSTEATISWVRQSTGYYRGTFSSGVLTDGKTRVMITPSSNTVGAAIKVYNAARFSDTVVFFECFDAAGNLADGVFCTIDITIYP